MKTFQTQVRETNGGAMMQFGVTDIGLELANRILIPAVILKVFFALIVKCMKLYDLFTKIALSSPQNNCKGSFTLIINLDTG